MLEPSLLASLQALWAEGDNFDSTHSERSEKRLNISPDTGRFLYQLSRSRQAMQVIEIGTSNGYSTIWLALAALANKGTVISADVSARKQALAAANLRKFGLEQQVTLQCKDGYELLAQTGDESVDLLFLDADRQRYAGYWPEICRVMARGGLLVMDNALSHAEECAAFCRAVLATHGYLAETYPIGKGQFVILKDL